MTRVVRFPVYGLKMMLERILLLTLFIGGAASCAKSPANGSASPTAPRGESKTENQHRSKPSAHRVASNRAPKVTKTSPSDSPSATTEAGPLPSLPSPFRRIIEERYGSLFLHGSDLLFAGQKTIANLATGEILAHCDDMRGRLLDGKNLYFAARMSAYSACPDEPFLLEYAGNRNWKLRRFIDAHHLLTKSWVAGTTIAAVVPYRLGPPLGYELVKIAGGVTPPRPMRGPAHPTDPDQKCYSELQQPTALHTFSSGALMVIGEYRCELPRSEEEELTEEEQKERGRPAIESFPKGSYKSQIFGLPIDELVSSIEGDSETLFILGKIKESWETDAGFELALFSFDGKSVTRLEADLTGVKDLVRGPIVRPVSNLENVRGDALSPTEGRTSPEGLANVRALPSELWLLDDRAVRRASEQGEPLWLPEGCEGPRARFWGENAWLSCSDGIYTTDPERRPMTVLENDDNLSCEQLNPRPEYAVRGLYQKASSSGGCGQRRSFERVGGGGKTKVLQMKVPNGQKPSPSNLKLEF